MRRSWGWTDGGDRHTGTRTSSRSPLATRTPKNDGKGRFPVVRSLPHVFLSDILEEMLNSSGTLQDAGKDRDGVQRRTGTSDLPGRKLRGTGPRATLGPCSAARPAPRSVPAVSSLLCLVFNCFASLTWGTPLVSKRVMEKWGQKSPGPRRARRRGPRRNGGWPRDATLQNPKAAGRPPQIPGLEAGLRSIWKQTGRSGAGGGL